MCGEPHPLRMLWSCPGVELGTGRYGGCECQQVPKDTTFRPGLYIGAKCAFFAYKVGYRGGASPPVSRFWTSEPGTGLPTIPFATIGRDSMSIRGKQEGDRP